VLQPAGPTKIAPPSLAVTSARLPGRDGLHIVIVREGRLATILPDDGSRPSGARVIDAEGAWLLPGFHDPHLHLMSLARSLTVDTIPEGVRSTDSLARVLRARSAALEPGAWLEMHRFDHHRMTGGVVPDHAQLDRWTSDRPVRLRHRNQRIDVLNSAALAECRLLTGGTPGGVELDPAGRPTGRLFNCGRLLRERCTTGPPARPRRDAVAVASRMLLEQGVTSIQDATAHNGDEELAALDALAREGVIRQRLWAMASGAGLAEGAISDDALIRTRHAKLVALEAELDLDGLITQARAARRHGLGVAIHATSEIELAAAVAVIETVRARRGSHIVDRIEHAFVASDLAVDAVARSGAAVVANPALVAEAGDEYRAAFAPDHHGTLHRGASWRTAGVRLAIGSDAPVTQASALETLAAAVARIAPDRQPLNICECLAPGEALAAMTCAPAGLIAAPMLGTLQAGAPADLVVTSGDGPFGHRVEATILAGLPVFVRERDRQAGEPLPVAAGRT
jgi:predicted amidohydrolase YtcJ